MKRIVMIMVVLGAVAVAQVGTSQSVAVKQPGLMNAKLQIVSGSAGLEKTVNDLLKSRAGAMWIGYTIPVEAKDRMMCCFDSWPQQNAGKCCLGCKLEKEGGSVLHGGVNQSECENLEPADFALVMLRSQDGVLTKIRAFSRDCGLDAAGLNVYWIDHVNPPESIKYLTKLAENDVEGLHKKSLAGQAVYAIAIHKDPAADVALESLLATTRPRRIREEVAIMLGSERGERGLAILRKIVKRDSDEKFREEALVGFSQSGTDAALRDLVEIAKTDPSSHVRGQAIFWLGQAGGRKEAQAITDAIDNDPETDVKKKAVFALSQMPETEGVPMLIHVAKTNKNAAVRREAVRWLGQTNDPRSLAFLEEILLGPKK